MARNKETSFRGKMLGGGSTGTESEVKLMFRQVIQSSGSFYPKQESDRASHRLPTDPIRPRDSHGLSTALFYHISSPQLGEILCSFMKWFVKFA